LEPKYGIHLSQRQQRELDILARLAKGEWKVETINTLPDSVALEYRLRSEHPQPDYCIVRGLDTESRDEFLEAHFARELTDRPILRTA